LAERWLKIIISFGAIGVAVLHLARPELQIDVITFGLIVVAILAWLNKLIKKAEFPGGWKVEFHDVQAAGEKITRSEMNQARPVETPSPSYVEISDRDPNLALVGLRIEIERRLRKLVRQAGLTEDRPLTYMIGDLRRLGVLSEASFSGLQTLVSAGNQAAHGAEVDAKTAAWAVDHGPDILAVLDAKLHSLPRASVHSDGA
jgi:Domain of unknown function (DUF4145)